MIRRLLMAALVAALSVETAARAQDAPPPPVEEEDDPAFARQPPPPLPPEEEDPGFVEAAPVAPEEDGHGPAVTAPPPPPKDDVPRRRRAAAPSGMKVRLGYRTFTLDEYAMPDLLKTDRFHAISLDAYPMSGTVRLGLVSQFGVETSRSDWFGAVGLAVGVQRLARMTPYGEIKAHTGLTRRTFCLATTVERDCQDHLTLLWGFGLEAGVDLTLSGKTRGTIAIGLERNQYFAAEAEDEMGNLAVFTDSTFTIKLGVGY